MFIAHTPLMFAEGSSDALFTGNFYISALALVGAIAAVLMAIFSGRRTPPLPEQLHRDFLPRSEFIEQRNKRDEEVRRIDDRAATIFQDIKSAEDYTTSEIAKLRTDMDREHRRLHEAREEFAKETRQMFTGIAKSLGAIENELSLRRTSRHGNPPHDS